MSPRRITLSRRKGWRLPEGAVVVARPTRWGNPFPLKDFPDRAAAIAHYRDWFAQPEQAELRAAVRAELKGRDLACWCPQGGPCHADILLDWANRS